MQMQYHVVDRCLHTLRQCDIPPVTKLRLEVQLFQIKLLLLRDDVRRDIRSKFCSDSALHNMEQQLARIAQGEAEHGTIEAVGRDLQQVALDLAQAITSRNK